MKRMLIVGGAGYIGSHLLAHRLAKTYEITALYHKTMPRSSDITLVKGNILDKESLEKCFKQPIDLVINAVGQISSDLEMFYRVNLVGNDNLLELIRKYNVPRTVLISSALVYGESCGNFFSEFRMKNPTTFYGQVKAEVEEMYLRAQVPVAILRLGNVYGKNHGKGVLHHLITACMKTKEFSFAVPPLIIPIKAGW